jgi:ferrous iron transport protein B
MLSRGWSYIVKAGTIILVCNTAVQLMQSFNWRFELVEEGMEHTSILAGIATPFAFILIPLGFGVWQMAAAAITGFIAKENVVGTIAVCYGITNFINVDELVLESGAEEVAAVFGITKVAALACLMFNLFTPPCFAAIGAMNAEIKDRKWFFGGIGLQFATGYTVAFLVYQLGTLFTEGKLGTGFLPGLLAVAAMVGVIVYLAICAKVQEKAEYTLE